VSLNHRPAATQKVDHQDHDREDQQDVNEPTQSVRTNQAEQPEHEQNYEDCPKHFKVPFAKDQQLFTLLHIDAGARKEPELENSALSISRHTQVAVGKGHCVGSFHRLSQD
jgi:hypothetical protein